MSVGKIISKIAQNTHDTFSDNAEFVGSAIRFFGSLAQGAITSQVPLANVYDLDIEVLTPTNSETLKNKIAKFFTDQAEKYNHKGLLIEAKPINGPIKPKQDPHKESLLLHVIFHDADNYDKIKPYVRNSIKEYSVPILGQLPNAANIGRIGLGDIVDEPSKRIMQILGKSHINSPGIPGVSLDDSQRTSPDSFEHLAYSVLNSTKNILSAIAPHISLPHFDSSSDAVYLFKEIFNTHPQNDLPLEINELKTQFRNGQDISISGLKGEVLNFLAYNDQMIRNLLGDSYSQN